MRFLDPTFLFGLLSIAVPVGLHLLFRRRVPVLDFPLARLVERAERHRQPRRRLNRVLLLAARALALALLALALARPALGPGRGVVAEGPLALVMLVDDSLSMGARGRSGETIFEEGVARAAELLGMLPAGSRVAVIPLSEPERAEPSGLAGELHLAEADLRALEPGLRHLRLGAGLEAARRLLDASPLPDRRVLLVTDLARHAFEGLRLTAAEPPRPRLELLVPAPRESAVNLSVSGLEVDVQPDGRLSVAGRVSAWGGAARDVVVELRAGRAGSEFRLAGRAKLSPGGGASAERRFELAAPGEGYGAVELSIAPDFLPADDRRHAVEHASRRLRVLLVDGDPQNLSFGSETFYLERALAPGVGLDLDSELVTVPELGPEDFEACDVAFLCNVPELSEQRAGALTEAVRRGLGLIVSLGDRIDQPVYNGRLGELLPATVGLQRQPAEPVAAVGLDPGLDLGRVRISSWSLLVPDPGARVLARTGSGDPLAVESTLGRGRVVMLATTLDRDWTELPIDARFLPFLHGLVARVAQRHADWEPPSVRVGESLSLEGLATAGALRVRRPDGRRVAASTEEPFAETDLPGVHVIEDAGRALAAFAVVTDPAESDLAPLPIQEAARLLAPAFELAAAGVSPASEGAGRPAWKPLLACLVALVASESWLARRAS